MSIHDWDPTRGSPHPGESRYTPSPHAHAHCHICGHWVRLVDRSPRVMYRHRYGGATGSDWCLGSREKVGAIIPGFIGPYVRDPRPSTHPIEDRELWTVTARIDSREIGSFTRRETMLTPKTTGTRAASMTHDELRPYAVTFQGKHGFVPTYDQLVEFVAEQGMHVQCQFNGHGQRYTYRVQEGEPVSIGDYLQVWSPMTERNELVRVVGIGRGSWTGHTKTAHRVDITVVD